MLADLGVGTRGSAGAVRALLEQDELVELSSSGLRDVACSGGWRGCGSSASPQMESGKSVMSPLQSATH